MKTQNTMQKIMRVGLAVMLVFATPFVMAGKNGGSGSGGTTTPTTQVYDTSFAVEYSYSCLGGGCHETNQALVDGYSQSVMTHAMVKCNTCHGTHTADEVGQPKPNLTGYVAGMGATGYIVGRDRCNACHTNQHVSGEKSTGDCKSCHTPHVFAPPSGGGGGGKKR